MPSKRVYTILPNITNDTIPEYDTSLDHWQHPNDLLFPCMLFWDMRLEEPDTTTTTNSDFEFASVKSAVEKGDFGNKDWGLQLSGMDMKDQCDSPIEVGHGIGHP